MIAYRRARAGLALALVFSAVTVVTSFPLATLVRQGGEIAAATSQLGRVRQENVALSASLARLDRPSTIEALAARDYGLVRAGQRAVVILPASSDGARAGTLADRPIPSGDLVPASAPLAATAPAHRGPGLWGRVVDRLEFWRWAL